MRRDLVADFTMRKLFDPAVDRFERSLHRQPRFQRVEELARHPRRLVADAAQPEIYRMAARTSSTRGPLAIVTWQAASCGLDGNAGR